MVFFYLVYRSVDSNIYNNNKIQAGQKSVILLQFPGWNMVWGRSKGASPGEGGRGYPKMVTNGDIGGRGYVQIVNVTTVFF